MPTTRPRRPRERPAQAVTTAGPSIEADRRRRMRAYLISMIIRTVSFPLAIWAFVSEWFVVGWVFAAIAVLVPSFAVMIANAVDRRRVTTGESLTSPQRALGAPEQPRADDPDLADGAQQPIVSTVIPGTAVDRRDHPPAP